MKNSELLVLQLFDAPFFPSFLSKNGVSRGYTVYLWLCRYAHSSLTTIAWTSIFFLWLGKLRPAEGL